MTEILNSNAKINHKFHQNLLVNFTLRFFNSFLIVPRNIFKMFWNFSGHFTNFIKNLHISSKFLHDFSGLVKIFPKSPYNFFNVCMEFYQNFPHPEIYFCKVYPKSYFFQNIIFIIPIKFLSNIFIEIPLNLIKIDSKFYRNVVKYF